MPRDSSGNYSLPVGNPVVTGTLIESDWANTTMDDIAASLTNSLDRYGQGGMEAQLNLINGDQSTPALSFTSNTAVGLYYDGTDVKYSNGAIDDALIGEAPDDTTIYGRGNKQWKPLDSGGYTPLPIGSIVQFSGEATSLPAGWLECDGRPVSRATYPDLADLYETSPNDFLYGDGDTTTTFNLPDFRGRVPIGVGTGTGLTERLLADQYGAEEVALTIAQMPSHAHIYKGVDVINVADGLGAAFGINNGQTTFEGGNQGHPNVQPSLAVIFAVKALVDTVEGGPTTINGHVIQDGTTTFAQRANLKFVGTGVTVTDDDVGDASVVTIDTGGGGGSGTYNEIELDDASVPSVGRAKINFKQGSNVTIAVTDDAANDRTDVEVSATPGAPVPLVLKEGVGWVIGGSITAGMSTGGSFIPVDSGGQATALVSAAFVLEAGTCSVQMYLAGAPIGPVANVSVTPSSITGFSTAVTDNNFLTLVVTVADVDAELLSFTAQLEHTI